MTGVDEKRCNKCGEDKPVDRFSASRANKDGRQSWCKACCKVKNDAYAVVRYEAWKAWLWELKSGPCTDCGNTFHPVVMEFDHLPGSGKRFNIGQAYLRSRETVMDELAKCELVCSNCHALRSWKRQQVQP